MSTIAFLLLPFLAPATIRGSLSRMMYNSQLSVMVRRQSKGVEKRDRVIAGASY